MRLHVCISLALLLVSGWLSALAQKKPQGKIKPYSLVVVDTIQVFNYTWRTPGGELRNTVSRYAPRETLTRIILTDLRGQTIKFPLNNLVRKELVPFVRPYASLPLDPVRPGFPLGILRRVGYRKLAPYGSLADLRLKDGWIRNALVLAPIAERVELITPENRILVLPGDSVLQWQKANPDTARYATAGYNTGLKRAGTEVDLYIEFAGGVAVNLLSSFWLSYKYGWVDDYRLGSTNLSAGVVLWKSMQIGFRMGLEIPYNQGEYTPKPTIIDDKYNYTNFQKQLFAVNTVLQLRFLAMRKPVFYTTALHFGAAHSSVGSGPWLEWSNGMSIRLPSFTFLILDTFLMGGANGNGRGFIAPGVRVGLNTLIPLWQR